MKQENNLTVFFALINLVAIISFAVVTPAQTPCPLENIPLTPSHTWQQNASVTVNVDKSKFTPEEYQCIKEAFEAFNGQNGQNSSNGGNASGVRFNVRYSNETVATQNGNYAQATNPHTGIYTNVYEVTRISTLTSGFAGTIFESEFIPESHAVSAITAIDPDITNCDALKETIAHEIAHTFGLNHCYETGPNSSSTCFYNEDGTRKNPPTSIMAYPTCSTSPCPANEANQTYGTPLLPNDCDKQKLAGHYNMNTMNQPDPTNVDTGSGGDGGGGDGGGGPDPICETITIPGQCYEVCVEWGEDYYDPYWGVWIVNVVSDCDIQCDPSTTEEICY